MDFKKIINKNNYIKVITFCSISLFLIILFSLMMAYWPSLIFYCIFAIVILLIYLGTFFVIDKFILDYIPKINENTKNIFVKINNKFKIYFSSKQNTIKFIRRSLAVLLGFIFLARFMGGQDYLYSVSKLESNFMNKFEVCISLLFNQFYIASIFLIIINEFITSINFKKIIKYIVTPILLICCFIIPYLVQGIVGDLNSNSLRNDPYGFRILLMGLEFGITLSFVIYTWYKDFKWDFDKKFLYPFFITLFLILITSINSYGPNVLFGEYIPIFVLPLDINITHRMFIYLAFILPIIYFVILYPFDETHRRAFLTFISLCVLFGYIGFRRYETWSSGIEALPLHLCNTAMYIIPLTLIFKSYKVFYFTMFINVIGAFLALLMPNYSESYGVFSPWVVEFYINHLYAFFMPILIVLLGVYKRPKIRYFIYSMIGFLLYFMLCVFLNTYVSANGGNVDFFFLNSDFIADKLGGWAEDIFNIEFSFNINGKTFVLHPTYLLVFYLVYVAFALFMWYIYELLFRGVDNLVSLYEKNKVYKKDKQRYLEMQKQLGVDMKNKKIEIDYNNLEVSLDIQNLKKRYGSNKEYTIKDFSLYLKGGKIYGFLGKNGAGKSTIIKSIVGMHEFNEGSISVCGYDVKNQEVQAKTLIGFVPDHYALYESLTGREYINYIADLYNVSKQDRDTRLESLLDKLELKDKFDKQIKTYSHGMKQKITIIGALIHDPKVWILDEPMTGVDPISIYQIKEVMKDHAKKGNIVFFSSHLIDVIKNLCDEIIIIKKGDFVYRDTIENLNENNVDLEQLFIEKTNDEVETTNLNKELKNESK